MDKKYQVFISSTYTDMKDERQTAVEAILDAGHIPAGMELFAASDKQQIEVIKGWIDKSDIFMLILGGRYGSVEPESGKSYIQLEYEYALKVKKPFFALYLTDDAIQKKAQGPLGLAVVERDDTKKLNDFRKQVKSKLCSEIEDKKDIKIQVPKAIRELSAANKLEGWVRASSVPDLSPLMGQLEALRSENEALKAATLNANAQPGLLPRFTGSFSESGLDLQLQLEISVNMEGAYETHRRTWNGTYRTMFSLIGARLLEEPADHAVHIYINKVLRDQTRGSLGVTVSEVSFQSMKMKFVTLGVIELTKTDKALCWSLTDNAKVLLMKLHAEA